MRGASGVLGIYSWMDTRNRKWFRVRGNGPSYDQFYAWLRDKPLAQQSDDWPWHFFCFEDQAHADALIAAFPDDYLGHEDEVVEAPEDRPKPRVDPAAQALWDDLATSLMEEIQREVTAFHAAQSNAVESSVTAASSSFKAHLTQLGITKR